jgi:hypothetical protein
MKGKLLPFYFLKLGKVKPAPNSLTLFCMRYNRIEALIVEFGHVSMEVKRDFYAAKRVIHL